MVRVARCAARTTAVPEQTIATGERVTTLPEARTKGPGIRYRFKRLRESDALPASDCGEAALRGRIGGSRAVTVSGSPELLWSKNIFRSKMFSLSLSEPISSRAACASSFEQTPSRSERLITTSSFSRFNESASRLGDKPEGLWRRGVVREFDRTNGPILLWAHASRPDTG
jgi:hypothetical protein